MRFIRFLALAFVFTISSLQTLHAEETDQFTLPPTDLQDLGSLASQDLYETLKKIVANTNARIESLLPKSKNSRYAAHQLVLRQNDAYIVDEFYKRCGPGFPRWLQSDFIYAKTKGKKPIQHREIWPWNTVYWLVFTQSFVSFLNLVPTINMYGYYFGTDKLDHFFMQGNTYYHIYTYFINHNRTPEQAQAAMILYGKITEQTYLGTLINGVYSNADLSANYAGWKFYMNIAHSVKIGDQVLPPILVLRDNKWEFSRKVDTINLLKPFLSDNLNEAWNPCRYSFMRNQIRRQILKRCESWIKQKQITPHVIEAKLNETRRWHGELYGHWLPEKDALTLQLCFEKKRV